METIFTLRYASNLSVTVYLTALLLIIHCKKCAVMHNTSTSTAESVNTANIELQENRHHGSHWSNRLPNQRPHFVPYGYGSVISTTNFISLFRSDAHAKVVCYKIRRRNKIQELLVDSIFLTLSRRLGMWHYLLKNNRLITEVLFKKG